VSFISLKLILPPMTDVLLPGGELLSLIKPQFEAGREKVPGEWFAILLYAKRWCGNQSVRYGLARA
jgi:hypothetical protein